MDMEPLSIGKSGVEAIAVAPRSIDIFLPTMHNGVRIRAGTRTTAKGGPGEPRITISGVSPGKLWSGTVDGLADGPVTITERAFDRTENGAKFDVVVIGATAAGTAAAVSAARSGASVLLAEETNRAGGMCSNGLSVTDMRSVEYSGGFFDEFRRRVVDYYGSGDGLRYEPRVANAIMKSLVYGEPRLTFLRRTRAFAERLGEGGWAVRLLDLPEGGSRSVTCRVLIDATYEADIAAQAGVKFLIQREARSPEEPHAGRIYYDNATDEILPGSTGEADHRLQSYAYLLTVKDYGEGADVTIPEPEGYDPEEFRHSPPWENTWAAMYAQIPNGKFELNQHPWGTDLPGINYGWPNASPDQREQIARQYMNRALFYLHYVQTEMGMKSVGLADDEYPDNEGLPHQFYVREARRMVGIACMTERDVSLAPTRPVHSPIAVGDYPMDSHATQGVVDPSARHRGEGEFWLVRQTPPYQVPLGVILPLGVSGLIVPTAVSATHVAYGTVRMEPVRMAMGQAAGVLAALSVQMHVEPAEVPYGLLREALLGQGALLDLGEPAIR